MSSTDTRVSIMFGVCRQDPPRWHEFDAVWRPIPFAYLRKRACRSSRPTMSFRTSSLWLDGQRHASLLYQHVDGKFGNPPSGPWRVQKVLSPKARDEGHKITGPGGLETVLLLARRTPPPPSTDLAVLIGLLALVPLRDVREVAVRGFDEGQPIGTLSMGLHRGIAEEADKVDDSLRQLMERLRTQGRSGVIKARWFAYRGVWRLCRDRPG